MPLETDSSIKGNHVLGQLGAVTMGLVVGNVNKGHGLLMATIAGIKQYCYSATIAALLIHSQPKIYDHFRKHDNHSVRPHIWSVAIPTIATIISTYVLHTLKGTPETINSTIPTAILAPIGYTILHTRRILKNSIEETDDNGSEP